MSGIDNIKDLITDCVDCGQQLPIKYQFDNRIRCPKCEKIFTDMTREERIAANKKIAERF